MQNHFVLFLKEQKEIIEDNNKEDKKKIAKEKEKENKIIQEEIEKRIKESHAFDDIITKEEYIYLLNLLKSQRPVKKVEVIDDQSALRRLQEMYKSVQ